MSGTWISSEDLAANQLSQKRTGEALILVGIILFAIMVAVVS